MDELRVYIPLDGEHFAAINRETGATAWTMDIESAWPPLVHDGVVYLAASDELHALDAATGNRPLARAAPPRRHGPDGDDSGCADRARPRPTPCWRSRRRTAAFSGADHSADAAAASSMAVNATGIYVSLVDRLVRVAAADGSIRWDRDAAW